jgi:hypothetical protein
MGFKKDWDLNSIRHQIWIMRAEMNNPRNDGWTTWGIKQELYQLKWLIDQTLAEASTYSGETEWLREQEQERIVKILKS